MRFCTHCRRFNGGTPTRCRYCGVGLAGRLCPRNHVNPPDGKLVFCGECGEPLERTWGASSVAWSRLLRAVLVLGAVCLVGAIVSVADASVIGHLAVVAFMLAGLWFCWQLVPAWARRIIKWFLRGCLKAVTGTGYKGRA